MILRSLTIAAMLLVAQSSADSARPVGVLVGLHHVSDNFANLPAGETQRPPPAAGQLRTIWIPILEPLGSGSTEAVEVPDLLLPRRSGFWRAGLIGTCAEETGKDVDGGVLGTETEIADYLWLAPVGQRPRVRLESRTGSDAPEQVRPCVKRDVYCDIDRRTQIFWIWPEYLSLNTGVDASCGAHPDGTMDYTVRRAGDWTNYITIGEALGAAGERRFRRALEAEKLTYKDNPECAADATFDPAAWHIEREPGGWKAEGWAKTYRLCGYGVSFTADVDLSGITGRRDDTSSWSRVKARIPGLTDAHFGPGGHWLGTTTRELLLFSDLASDRPVLRIPISADDTVIMVEWATGANVARWSTAVQRARDAGRLEPLVIRPPSNQ